MSVPAQVQDDPVTSKVLEQLAATPYASASLERLSGGTANFTYRASLTSPAATAAAGGRPTVVVKHAEPYLATNPAWAFDVVRSHYEATMLRGLAVFQSDAAASGSPEDGAQTTITTPRLLLYDPKTDTLVMSDCQASLHLKTHLTSYAMPGSQALRVGKALGSWARRFHAWADVPAQAELAKALAENIFMPSFKCTINYGRLEATIAQFPHILEPSRSRFQEIYAAKQAEVRGPGRQLIHGDLWTGNVLLPDRPLNAAQEPLELMIIDWELAHLSDVSYDIGQCLAELYLLYHFQANQASMLVISAFLRAYGQVKEGARFAVALLFGVHLIVWPPRVAGWGGGQKMEDCVALGNEFVISAWERNRDFFRGSPLHDLFFPAED